jgi:hypothetical protein
MSRKRTFNLKVNQPVWFRHRDWKADQWSPGRIVVAVGRRIRVSPRGRRSGAFMFPVPLRRDRLATRNPSLGGADRPQTDVLLPSQLPSSLLDALNRPDPRRSKVHP